MGLLNTTFEYEGGNLIREIRNLYKGKIVTSYEKNRSVSEIKYDENNRIEWSVKIEYNGNLKNGNVVRTSYSKDNQIERVVEDNYKNGVIVQHIETCKGVSIISTFVYNEKGDIVEVSSTDGHIEKYVYDYDPFNNWVKRIYSTDEGVQSITERSIEYF